MGVEAAAPDQPPVLSQQQISLVFASLLVGMLLAALDGTVVATALPTIVGDLGGLSQLSWVVTGYLLTSTASTPLWGKLGDLYGRKSMFQAAIVIFLAGSALSGLSQNMGELIVFRALQGIGGGGLLITAQALIADVASPREQGHYQGIFGAVFGLTSVAGPLLGGFLVQALSWRWVFYVNLPVGALALAIAAVTLPRTATRVHHAIDYLGTGLLATAVTCLILLTTLGGTAFPWASPEAIGLAVIAVVLLAGFVWTEHRAPEPVFPLSLFRNSVFVMTSVIGFVVGFALYGAITFLPVFLQTVGRAGPATSGLRMVPMMLGVLVASVLSGQLITKTGRYKIFPIVGSAVMSGGLFLLSTMGVETGLLTSSAYMLVFGFGLGLIIQVLIIAVQNSVEYHDLGAATSGASFFRSMGGVFGVAVYGALFTALLASHVEKALAGISVPAGFDLAALRSSPEAIGRLQEPLHSALLRAYAGSLDGVFMAGVPFALAAFALTWFLREVPLKATSHATDPGSAYGMPVARSSHDELRRALSVLSRRQEHSLHALSQTALAELGLDQHSAWLLLQLHEHDSVNPARLGKRLRISEADVKQCVGALAGEGLVAQPAPDGPISLTPAGRDAAEKLIAARQHHLEGFLAGWEPQKHEEVRHLVERTERSLRRQGSAPAD